MNVLAIDPGTATGWARKNAGKLLAGRQVFKAEKDVQPGERLNRFREWLMGMVVKYPSGVPEPLVDLIAIEAPVGMGQSGGAANRLAIAWNTIAEEVAYACGCQYVEVSPPTLKKFATGHGFADKELMLIDAIQKWPQFFPEKIHGIHMIATQQKGKRVVGIYDPVPDPALFEISDALWVMEWALKEVVLSYD